MMVNEKVAVVDLKNWRGNEISEELRRRGWRVSYCEDAKKAIYLPKDKVSIVITTPDSNLVHKAFESYRTMKDRGETAILLLTIDRPIAQVKESLDMCMNEACLINKPANVADFIEEYIKDRPSKVYEVTMAEQVKMMTWKLEGLAEDQVRLLCNTFSSPKKVLKAASNRTECTPETPLDSVLKDVNCWIAQDYYVE